MEKCQKCGSDRIYNVDGKTSDFFVGYFQGKEHDGYVTPNVGIGGDDYIEFGYCLNCGQIQGDWPVSDPDFAGGSMKFECEICDFTTENEDEIFYCDCGRIVCQEDVKSIEHQGWDEEMCLVCYKAYNARREAMGDRI